MIVSPFVATILGAFEAVFLKKEESPPIPSPIPKTESDTPGRALSHAQTIGEQATSGDPPKSLPVDLDFAKLPANVQHLIFTLGGLDTILPAVFSLPPLN